MAEPLLEMAKELTQALIEAGNVSLEDMNAMLQKTYATLAALKTKEESGTTIAVPAAASPSVGWKKSITKRAIMCLSCGQSSKQLTSRHLMTHGLDARSYRAKYGIPRTQPLAARDTTGDEHDSCHFPDGISIELIH